MVTVLHLPQEGRRSAVGPDRRTPPPSFFVGIACSAESFTASLYRSGPRALEELLPTTAHLENSAEGFRKLEGWLDEHDVIAPLSIVCIAGGGAHAEHLCYRLDNRGWSVTVESHGEVTRNIDPREGSDGALSARVAEYAWRFHDRLASWAPNDLIVEQVRTLISVGDLFSTHKRANHQMLATLRRRYLDIPEARTIHEEMIAALDRQIERTSAEIRNLIAAHPTLGPAAAERFAGL